MSLYILKPTLRSTYIPLLLFRSSFRYCDYRPAGARRPRSRQLRPVALTLRISLVAER